MSVTVANNSSSDYWSTRVGEDETLQKWHGRTGATSPAEEHSVSLAKALGYEGLHKDMPTVNGKPITKKTGL